MIKKKLLYILSAVLLLSSILLMIFAKGILMFTQAGPDAPLVSHYYTYLNPRVYFAGGMYFAPLAVFLAVISLLALLVTIFKSNRGKASLVVSTVCLVCVVIVTLAFSITIPNILIVALSLLSAGITYWTSYKL